ncbi:HXXXD-type acyl-transferase family protein [Rhynchospora pubera]|uniref:HXXXD-type acyl-transferase family protein n=1 Tax=Rhynchospora pubera TaxID=906938 RepID=A0AAV8G5V9_9POAL|nr:HXXXD-type acyl-transferase family protein [Rhynchospora pubera]
MTRRVEILESSMVVPAEDTLREMLSLSNIDLLKGIKRSNTIYLYKNNEGAKDFFSAEILKSALAKTLVLFYPLAGRHVVGGSNQIDCNAEGVLFQVARSEVTADSIQFEPMSEEIIELFIPKKPHSSSPLIMLQVTHLKCGSVVLGTSTNHIFIDGRGAALMFRTWSQIARGDLKSVVQPSFDNGPLCARSPPKVSFEFPVYNPDDPDPSEKEDNTKSCVCVLRLFKLSAEQIRKLKMRCSNISRVSTFCAVSALVWKCYCSASAQELALAPDRKSSLYFPADIRNRIDPPIPDYCANGAIRMAATSQVFEITSSPIGDVARTVKAEIDRVTDEYIRSFIDYVKVMSDQKMPVKTKYVSESDLRIRTILGVPLCDVDFGWGAPQLFSWEKPTENRVAYIMNQLGNDNGGIKLTLALHPSTMKLFEKLFYEELELSFTDDQIK